MNKYCLTKQRDSYKCTRNGEIAYPEKQGHQGGHNACGQNVFCDLCKAHFTGYAVNKNKNKSYTSDNSRQKRTCVCIT